jgi:hypothetical protein
LEPIILVVRGRGSGYEEPLSLSILCNLFLNISVYPIPVLFFRTVDSGEVINIRHKFSLLPDWNWVLTSGMVDSNVPSSRGLFSLLQRVLLLEHDESSELLWGDVGVQIFLCFINDLFP